MGTKWGGGPGAWMTCDIPNIVIDGISRVDYPFGRPIVRIDRAADAGRGPVLLIAWNFVRDDKIGNVRLINALTYCFRGVLKFMRSASSGFLSGRFGSERNFGNAGIGEQSELDAKQNLIASRLLQFPLQEWEQEWEWDTFGTNNTYIALWRQPHSF